MRTWRVRWLIMRVTATATRCMTAMKTNGAATPKKPMSAPANGGPDTRDTFCTIEFMAIAFDNVSSVETS